MRRGGRARLKASDSKSDRGVSPSGVQILSPPPFFIACGLVCAGWREGSSCEVARDATTEAYSLYVERGASAPTKQMGPYPRPAGEGWPSGRRCGTGNAVYGQLYRGFESHPLRHSPRSQNLNGRRRSSLPLVESSRVV